MKIQTKKAVVPPDDVKSTIDRILEAPVDETGRAVANFVWDFDKGDLHHWVPLLDRFDEYLERHVGSRKDLALDFQGASQDPPLPEADIIFILRATTLIMENCRHNYLYGSSKHVEALLKAKSSDVVVEALRVVNTWTQKSAFTMHRPACPRVSSSVIMELVGEAEPKPSLLSLGAGDVSAAQPASEFTIKYTLPSFKPLDISLIGRTIPSEENLPRKQTIILQTASMPADESEAMQHIIKEHSVPNNFHFRALLSLRAARSVSTPHELQQRARIWLLAYGAALWDDHDVLAWVATQPDGGDALPGIMVDQMAAVLKVDSGVPDDIQTLVLKALAWQLVAKPRCVRSSFLSKTIEVMLSGAINSPVAVLMREAVASLVPGDAPPPVQQRSPKFTEALLSFFAALGTSNTGTQRMLQANVLPTLLPLLKDTDPAHVWVVVKTLALIGSMMELENATVAEQFSALGGRSIIVDRLKAEMAAAAQSSVPLHHPHRALLRSLLGAVSMTLFSPTVAAGAVEEDSPGLFSAMVAVLNKPDIFGAGLFSLAVSMVSNIINHDPLQYRPMETAGIPSALIGAVRAGVPPSQDALLALPGAINAMCMNTNGVELVRESGVLGCIVSFLSTKKYIKALRADGASILGGSMEELSRHCSQLRPDIVNVVLDTMRALCALGAKEMPGTSPAAAPGGGAGPSSGPALNLPESESMEADNFTAEASSGDDDDVSYLVEGVAYTARMLEGLLGHQEVAKLFVEKGGIELLLAMYKLPGLPASFGATNASHSILSAFRVLLVSAAALPPTIFAPLRTELAVALNLAIAAADKLGVVCIPDLPDAEQEPYMRAVTRAEGLISLAAAAVRNSALLLGEFSEGGSEGILGKIGRLEKLVLMQAAVADEWRLVQDHIKAAKARAKADAILKVNAKPADPLTAGPSEPAAPASDQARAAAAATATAAAAPTATATPSGSAMDIDAPQAEEEGGELSPAHDVMLHALYNCQGFYQAVSKAIHVPTRRRDIGPPTPAAKAAAYQLAAVLKGTLVHASTINSSEHSEDLAASFASADGRRCRYLMRALDGIFGALIEARRRCSHALVLNYFVACGGMSAFLWQFRELVALLQRLPELTDPKALSKLIKFIELDETKAYIYNMLGRPTEPEDAATTYRYNVEGTVGKFLDIMMSVTFVPMLAMTTHAASLLVVDLPSASANAEPTTKDAATFVRKLWGEMLGAVMPLWREPATLAAHWWLVQSVATVIRNCTEKEASMNTLAAVSAPRPSGRPARSPTPPADPVRVQQIVDMGFTDAQAREALRRVGNAVEIAIAWLAEHPEEAEAAETEAQRLAAEAEAATKAAEAAAASAAAAEPSTSGAAPSQAIEVPEPPTDSQPSAAELLQGALHIVSLAPSTAFALCDLLKAQLTVAPGAVREEALAHLHRHLVSACEWAEASQQVSTTPLAMELGIPPAQHTFAVCHLSAILITEDVELCKLARAKGLAGPALRLLQAWKGGRWRVEGEEVALGIPKWVDCLLLLLAPLCVPHHKPKPPPPAAAEGSAGVQLQDVQQALQEVDVAGSGPVTASNTAAGPSEPATTTAAAGGSNEVTSREPPGPSGQAAAGAASKTANALEGALAAIAEGWEYSCGIEADKLPQAAKLGRAVLHRIVSRGGSWTLPDLPTDSGQDSITQSDPRSSVRAVLQFLASITKHRSVADALLADKILPLLLSIPATVYSPALEPYVLSILRNLVEDTGTLQAAMEAEIRSAFASHAKRERQSMFARNPQQQQEPTEPTMHLRQFFSSLGQVAAREPRVFMQAAMAICEVTTNGALIGGSSRRVVIRIRGASQPAVAEVAANEGAPAAGDLAANAGAANAGPVQTPVPAPKPSSPKSAPPPPSVKPARKPSHALVEVVNALLNSVAKYTGAKPEEKKVEEKEVAVPTTDGGTAVPQGGGSDAVVPAVAPAPEIEGAAAAAPEVPAATEPAATAEPAEPAKKKAVALTPAEREDAVQSFALRALAEFNLRYQHCTAVILKRDNETAAAAAATAEGKHSNSTKRERRAAAAVKPRPLFDRILEVHIALAPKNTPQGTQLSVAEAACYFLASVCIRSVEGRRRVVGNIARVLNEASRTDEKESQQAPPPGSLLEDTPFNCNSPHLVAAALMLTASLLAGQRLPRTPVSSAAVTMEVVKAMKEVGMAACLSRVILLIDLKHKQASKATDLILRSLEMLTRVWPTAKPTAGGAAGATPGAPVPGALQTRAQINATATPAAHPDDTEAGPEAMAAAEEVLEAMGRERTDRSRSRDRQHDRIMERMVEDMIYSGADDGDEEDSLEMSRSQSTSLTGGTSTSDDDGMSGDTSSHTSSSSGDSRSRRSSDSDSHSDSDRDHDDSSVISSDWSDSLDGHDDADVDAVVGMVEGGVPVVVELGGDGSDGSPGQGDESEDDDEDPYDDFPDIYEADDLMAAGAGGGEDDEEVDAELAALEDQMFLERGMGHPPGRRPPRYPWESAGADFRETLRRLRQPRRDVDEDEDEDEEEGDDVDMEEEFMGDEEEEDMLADDLALSDIEDGMDGLDERERAQLRQVVDLSSRGRLNPRSASAHVIHSNTAAAGPPVDPRLGRMLFSSAHVPVPGAAPGGANEHPLLARRPSTASGHNATGVPSSARYDQYGLPQVLLRGMHPSQLMAGDWSAFESTMARMQEALYRPRGHGGSERQATALDRTVGDTDLLGGMSTTILATHLEQAVANAMNGGVNPAAGAGGARAAPSARCMQVQRRHSIEEEEEEEEDSDDEDRDNSSEEDDELPLGQRQSNPAAAPAAPVADMEAAFEVLNPVPHYHDQPEQGGSEDEGQPPAGLDFQELGFQGATAEEAMAEIEASQAQLRALEEQTAQAFASMAAGVLEAPRAGTTLRRELETLRTDTASPPMSRPRRRQRTESGPTSQPADTTALQPQSMTGPSISQAELARALGGALGQSFGAPPQPPASETPQDTMMEEAEPEPEPAAEPSIDPSFVETLQPSLAAAVSQPPADASEGVPQEAPSAAAAVEEPAPAAAAVPGAEAPAPAPAGEDEPMMEGIDPEFMAALPPEIQMEVLEQQRRERRLRDAAAARERERAEAEAAAAAGPGAGGGAPGTDGDLAAVLASFPAELRHEVLLGADSATLAGFPEVIQEEARRLRARYGGRFYVAGAAGGEPAAEEEGEEAGEDEEEDEDGEPVEPEMDGLGIIRGPDGSIIRITGRAPRGYARRGRPLIGHLVGRQARGQPPASAADALRAAKEKTPSPDVPPQLEEKELCVLLRLLRVGGWSGRTYLNRLFANLAASKATREFMTRLLISILRCPLSSKESDSSGEPDDMEAMNDYLANEDAAKRAGVAPKGAVNALTALGLILPEDEGKLQHGVVKRVLDVLHYLCSNQTKFTENLINASVPPLAVAGKSLLQVMDKKGKGKMDSGDNEDLSMPALDILFALPTRQVAEEHTSLRKGSLELLSTIMNPFAVKEQEILDREIAAKAKRAADEAKAEEEAKEDPPADSPDAPPPPAGDNSGQEAGMDTTLPASATTPPVVQAPEPMQTEDAQGPAASEQPQEPAPAAAVPAAAAGVVPGGDEAGPSVPAAATTANASAVKEQSDEEKERAWMEGAIAHRPAFQRIPAETVRALTRLLQLDATKDDVASQIKVVLQGLAVIAPEHWTSVLEELQTRAASMADEMCAALTSLTEVEFNSSAAMSSEVSKLGRRFERVASCMWEGLAELVLDRLEDKEPWLSDSAIAARNTAAEVLDSIQATLDPTVWTAFAKAAAWAESALRTYTPPTTAPAIKVLPAGVAQLQPLLEAYFLFADCTRVVHTPVDVLASQEAGEDEAGFPTALGFSPTLTPAQRAPSWISRSQSQSFHMGSGSGSLSQSFGAPGSPSKSASPNKQTGGPETKFLRFAERHRRLTNMILQHSPGLLNTSFALLKRVPKLLDFDNKRHYFRNRIKKLSRAHAGQYRSLGLTVRRAHVFEDSFNQLRNATPAQLRSKLTVRFAAEEGVDAGGLTREWYQVMSREMFNPGISLFEAVPDASSTFQPNPNSAVQSDVGRGTSHLDYFKFVGRVVGKALHDDQHIDAHFTRSFYKHMLGAPLTYEDIEAVDPDYYKNLRWMLENDITDVLDLVFAEEVDYFGRKSTVELCPGGASLKVSNDNKREYVDLVARHRMTTAIRPQIDAFLGGFWDVVPRSIVELFNDHELELMISGLPDINVDDLRANTDYQGGYSANSEVVRWFWDVVGTLDREGRALLLQFVTGTSKVPLEGFKALQGNGGPQKFQIHKAFVEVDRLPTAHTCFNQLDLPEYTSKEQLRERLMTAIHEGSEGYAFS